MDLTFENHRAEYRGDERIDLPHPGIEEFKKYKIYKRFVFQEKTIATGLRRIARTMRPLKSVVRPMLQGRKKDHKFYKLCK